MISNDQNSFNASIDYGRNCSTTTSNQENTKNNKFAFANCDYFGNQGIDVKTQSWTN